MRLTPTNPCLEPPRNCNIHLNALQLVTDIPPPQVQLLLRDTMTHSMLGRLSPLVQLAVLAVDVKLVASDNGRVGDGDGEDHAKAGVKVRGVCP